MSLDLAWIELDRVHEFMAYHDIALIMIRNELFTILQTSKNKNKNKNKNKKKNKNNFQTLWTAAVRLAVNNCLS